MRSILKTIVILGTIALLPREAAAEEATANDLLIVWPIDSTEITIDNSVSTAALLTQNSRRRGDDLPVELVARSFTLFGDALSRAARNVDVIDSSAAPLSRLFPNRIVTAYSAESGTLAFSLPRQRDAESARYALVLRQLSFSQETRTVARRTVAPSPPGFDPATGMLTPGIRRAYTEGPGRITTLTVKRRWLIWDYSTEAALLVGTAQGTSSFRGDARRSNWDEAVRALAKDLLRQTNFSPF
jgi:hypothetical protein